MPKGVVVREGVRRDRNRHCRVARRKGRPGGPTSEDDQGNTVRDALTGILTDGACCVLARPGRACIRLLHGKGSVSFVPSCCCGCLLGHFLHGVLRR
jgi:hypothetical protein